MTLTDEERDILAATPDGQPARAGAIARAAGLRIGGHAAGLVLKRLMEAGYVESTRDVSQKQLTYRRIRDADGSEPEVRNDIRTVYIPTVSTRPEMIYAPVSLPRAPWEAGA